ncbi:MAG: hypothetical protein AVO35_05730 [Candidatus Aegiribacteria sp. MLS_C]|nr:MAG: hypothetical protein AVO35_05730 [Candidatus Aegiribacteria sp. MLS_C]
MKGLIPSFISDRCSQDRRDGILQATCMFIDICGFSAMTQALMNNGKEGAEVLAEVINSVFTPAIGTIYRHGGFVSSFAGDAFTSIFPSDSARLLDSLSAAIRLRDRLRKEGVQITKFGSFDLSVRISLSFGDVSWGIIPHEAQSTFHFGGNAIVKCTEYAMMHAATGEVVLDGSVVSELEGTSGVTLESTSEGYRLLSSIDSPAPEWMLPEPIDSHQEEFVPPEVLELNRRGEFRDIVSCYMTFETAGDLSSGIAGIISLARRFGGYFNKMDCRDGGGMILVLFGAPVNPGNLYRRALDFAIAAGGVSELRLRTGLACGTVFAGFVGSGLRSEYTALGSVVNLSARFAQSGGEPFIYLDETIYRQCRSLYDMVPLEPAEFRGFDGRVPVFQLSGKRLEIPSSAFGGRMVGREREMVQLEDLMRPVGAGVFGGIVYLFGNPGVGKSRLVHEIARRNRFRTLLLQTDGILRKPLNPFTGFFRQYFDQEEELSLEERKSNFESRYRELTGMMQRFTDTARRPETTGDLTRVKSLIGSVIGLSWEDSVFESVDPDDRRVIIRLAVSEFFRALSLTEAVVLVIEDIQWLDDESKGVFELMTRSAEGYPLMILATGRFDDDGSSPLLRSDPDVPSHSITLRDLSEEQTKLLVEDLLGGRTDDCLAAYIQERTEGNPFYTEQFCLYLRDRGIISTGDGVYRLEREPADIPTDINMVLVSRIDRLSEKLKETVQIASVLGREFEIQALGAMIRNLGAAGGSDAPSSDSGVLHLVNSIEEEGIWSAMTEFICMFNHSLLRDAAYEMQLRTRLRDLHGMAGDVVRDLHPDDMTLYADIAHHYELAEEWEKAIEYSGKAADYFHRSIRYDEALAYRRKSLSVCLRTLGGTHSKTARCYSDMGVVLSDMGDFGEALSCHRKALSIRLGLFGEEHPDTARSYSFIGEVCSERGEYDPALENLERAIAVRRSVLGEMHPDTATSYNDIGAVYLDTNRFDKALEYYRKALSIERQTLGEMHPSTACSYNNIGHVHSVMGDYDKALEYYEKALAIQKETLSEKHPHTATLYSNIASLYWKKNDFGTALEYSEKAHLMQKELLGEKHPSTARSYNNIGVIHARQGHFDEALAYYERALAIRMELLGERHPDTINSYNNIGICLHQNGNNGRALRFSEKALALGREVFGENHPNTALAMGSIARICSSRGDYGRAESLFLQAYSILSGSLGNSHPYSTRTLASMADMYETMGRPAEAEKVRARLGR